MPIVPCRVALEYQFLSHWYEGGNHLEQGGNREMTMEGTEGYTLRWMDKARVKAEARCLPLSESEVVK